MGTIGGDVLTFLGDGDNMFFLRKFVGFNTVFICLFYSTGQVPGLTIHAIV